MVDVLQTADGDIAITNGTMTFVTGADEVAQAVMQRLRTFQGECFLDTSLGVPWKEYVLTKNPDMEQAMGLVKREILATPNVSELVAFGYDLNNRTRALTLTFTVRTPSGNASGEVTV